MFGIIVIFLCTELLCTTPHVAEGALVIDDMHADTSMKEFAKKFLVRFHPLHNASARRARCWHTYHLTTQERVEPFSAERQQLVRAIGQQAAVAIDNARLYRQAQNESKRAERSNQTRSVHLRGRYSGQLERGSVNWC